jgi:hypothetical protein
MIRNIEIRVDGTSWPDGAVPHALSIPATMGSWLCCVEAALLSTAIWTRPPVVHGFHLSDWWAWLRYLPALANTPELRLRDEWGSVDAHQKAVMSDDFGVGFSTWFLMEHLHFLCFVDTTHFLRCVAPSGWYALASSSKTGKKKSPDYVALDNQLRLNVLECKGSQADRYVLASAVAQGKAQKQNLKHYLGPSFNTSLAIGLFTPQWNSSAMPELLIADPEFPDARWLKDIPQTVIEAAFGQLLFAKLFALMGLPSLATSLADQRTEQLKKVAFSRDEIDSLRRRDLPGDLLLQKIVYHLPSGALVSEGKDFSSIVFEARCKRRLVETLIETRHLPDDLANAVHSCKGTHWEHRSTTFLTELSSPFGFHLSISCKERERARNRDSDNAS